MRKMGRWLLGLSLVFGVASRGIAQDPKEIIDRAIRAHAGTEAQLAKRKNCISKSRGILVLPGAGDAPAIREGSFAFPDRVKWTGEYTQASNKIPFVITLDGLKGWRLLFGTVEDMTTPEYDAVRDELHFFWVCTLVPLKERTYTLTLLPEIKVNDRPAVGVKVESRGQGPIQLYFDQRDQLLVKGVFNSREAGLPLPKEVLFSDYKDFDGIKQPTRQITYMSGRKVEDWTYESYRFPAQIDPKVFAKP